MFKKLLLISLLFFCNSLFAATQPLTIVLDWFINPDHAPLFVAEQQGYFKQQGLDVKFIPPADPNDPPKLVAAGKADLAIDYQPQLVLQVAQGLPLVRIATLIATPLNCLAVTADSNIHSIKDLKGKKIGYSTDALGDAMLAVMLQQNGLTTKDVKLINVKYDLVQALLSNNVDAIVGVMRNFEPIEMELAHHPARLFYAEENGMPPYDELIIVANKNKLNDPRLPAFLRALNLGEQYLVNHPEESWQTFAKNHPELNNELNHRAWLTTLPRFSLTPATFDKSRYQNLALFLQKQNLIKTAPELTSYAVELNY
jgi:putative hydroxymethylpyrimidine transport system substrate-binding protein